MPIHPLCLSIFLYSMLTVVVRVEPLSIQLITVNSSCVRLSWTTLQYGNDVTKSYQYHCRDTQISGPASEGIGYETNITVCGYEPCQEVQCRVFPYVPLAGHPTVVHTSPKTRTASAAPSLPQDLAVSSRVETLHLDKLQWKYKVQWKALAELNCARLHPIRPYILTAPGVYNDSYPSTSVILYIDSEQTFTVSVSARNNESMVSENASLTVTAPQLAPYKQATDIRLDAISPYCVKLGWKEPQQSNRLSGYKYRCTSSNNWTQVGRSATSVTVCGFAPYEEVKCDIKAYNGAGDSQIASSPNITVYCAPPMPPTDLAKLEEEKTIDAGRERWRYKISWKAPTILNCARLHSTGPYRLTAPGVYNDSYPSTSVTLYIDSEQTFTVSVSARNNEGLVSENASLTLTALQLPPYKPPEDLTVKSTSPYCVKLSWKIPQYNNSLTGYKYLCTSKSTWSSVNESVTSMWVCDYSPYQEVKCDVEAYNDAGDSPTASSPKVRTDCAGPTAPRNLQIRTLSRVIVSNKYRWSYTASWKFPSKSNCAGLHPDSQYNVVVSSGITNHTYYSSTSVTFLVDSEQRFTVSVWSRNSAGMLSLSPASEKVTAPLLPPYLKPNVTLVPENSTCVKLAWEDREYPNRISGYKYKCTDHSSQSQAGKTVTDVAVCGYTPYQEVQCNISAYNSAGDSQAANPPSVRTDCAAPSPPTDLQVYELISANNSGRLRWRYGVSWKAPIYVHCASLHNSKPYKLRTPAVSRAVKYRYAKNQFYVDSEEMFTVSVWARNNKGLTSPATSLNITSLQLAPQVRPLNTSLSAINSTCVTLSWAPPLYPNRPLGYKYQCTSDLNWRQLGKSVTVATVCGHSPCNQVQCHVKAYNDAGDSQIASSSRVTTSKAAPSPPRNLTLSQPMKVTNSGRVRWNYTVTWQAPLRLSCGGLHQTHPYKLQAANITKDNYTNISFILTSDSEETFTVTVWTRDAEGLLSPDNVSLTEVAPLLPPQTSPLNTGLSVINSTCVRLSWAPPLYPNRLSGYKYRCTSGLNWTQLGKSVTVATVCGHSPCQQVQCDVKTYNDAGDSQIASSSVVTTSETAPSPPRNLAISEPSNVTDSGRERWRYTATWQAPLRLSCGNLHQTHPYKLQAANITKENYANSTVTVTVDSEVTFTVTVWTRNNEGLLSSENVSLTKAAPQLSPQTSPLNTSLSAINSTCVTLSWAPPLYPNRLSGYKYRCTPRSTWIQLGKQVADVVACDYSPYQLVQCHIKAYNTSGSGQAASSSVRTGCDAPSPPTDLKVLEINRTSDSGRERWRYSISWEAPLLLNCESLMTPNSYRLQTPKQDSTNYNSTTNEFYVDSEETFSVSVWARNNAGFISSDPETLEFTAPLLSPNGRPMISAESNSTCIFLTLQPPEQENITIEYYKASEILHLNRWQEARVFTQVSVCGFEPGSKVRCDVVAENSAGSGPAASISIFTGPADELDESTTREQGTAASHPVDTVTIGLSVAGSLLMLVIIVVIVSTARKFKRPSTHEYSVSTYVYPPSEPQTDDLSPRTERGTSNSLQASGCSAFDTTTSSTYESIMSDHHYDNESTWECEEVASNATYAVMR